MSSVIQTQGILQIAATLADAVTTTVDVPRPQTTPAEPPYAEGTDHVTRPPFLREEEAGAVVIDLPAAFVSAAIFLRRASVRKIAPAAQKGLQDASSAFFPTGAPTDTTFVYELVNTGTANTLPTNADAVRDLLGNLRAGATVRSFPGITLKAGEFVRLEMFQATGGAIGPATISAVYKLGLNNTDTGKP